MIFYWYIGSHVDKTVGNSYASVSSSKRKKNQNNTGLCFQMMFFTDFLPVKYLINFSCSFITTAFMWFSAGESKTTYRVIQTTLSIKPLQTHIHTWFAAHETFPTIFTDEKVCAASYFVEAVINLYIYIHCIYFFLSNFFWTVYSFLPIHIFSGCCPKGFGVQYKCCWGGIEWGHKFPLLLWCIWAKHFA